MDSPPGTDPAIDRNTGREESAVFLMFCIFGAAITIIALVGLVVCAISGRIEGAVIAGGFGPAGLLSWWNGMWGLRSIQVSRFRLFSAAGAAIGATAVTMWLASAPLASDMISWINPVLMVSAAASTIAFHIRLDGRRS